MVFGTAHSLCVAPAPILCELWDYTEIWSGPMASDHRKRANLSPLHFSPAYYGIAAVFARMDGVPVVLQLIGQPIQVAGRLDHDAGEENGIGGTWGQASASNQDADRTSLQAVRLRR